MKVVLTVHQFLPEYFYGTEILTFETAKHLKKLGHDVIVFSGFPDPAQLQEEERFDQYDYDGITVHRFHHSYTPMGEQTNIMELQYTNHLLAAYFKKFLMDEKPDIVHFFHFARLSASMIDVCVELGISTIFTPTDFWIICPTSQLRLPNNHICKGPDKYGINCLRHVALLNQTRWVKILKFLPDFVLSFIVFLVLRHLIVDKKYTPMIKALLYRRNFLIEKVNKIGKIITPSKLMMNILIENGVIPQKIISIPFGLNFSSKNNIKTINKKSEFLKLGFIGSLTEHKGIHILLEAVSKLKNQNLEVSIYGNPNDDPKYFAKLKKLAGDNSRISFLGTFPNHKISEVLSSLDALVIPSLWIENTPLVLYSAQAVKCPIIASDVKGISEIIEHGKNGLLFEMGNSVELEKIISNILEDNNLLKRLSENAKAPLRIEVYVEKIVDVYKELFELEHTL